jgi:hypothetical protein
VSFRLPMPKPDGGFDCRHTVTGAVAEALLPAFCRRSAPYAPPHAAYDSKYGRDQLPLLAGLAAAGIGSAVGTATHALLSGPGRAEIEDSKRRTKMATQYRRVSRDQEPDDTDEGLNKIKLFLKNRLDPQDYARLEQMLQQLSGGGEPDDSAQREWERNDKYAPEGQDEPEPFRGRPSGGRVNWNEDAQSALLPNGPGYQNIPEENRAEFRDRDRRYAQDSRSGGGYYAMFPGNAKVVTSNYGG